MSKLSFRARALDPTKPMPIYLAEELPDLPEYSAINRAVPQMPSGMEKEEESEHHLQRAICTGLIIPTPEVFDIDYDAYNRNYPANFKITKQMIHMQPLGMEQDIPDYDMDSADEAWVNQQARRLDLNPLKFEQMMDRLEKSSGQTVVTLNEAKALLKQDDELSIAVYDYWLNKRLKLQHPLILSVRTENRAGAAANNPYLAFRRRTEKMQTRKNRKNDETSYEKMLKLRRDLSRAVTLLELIKRREKTKREHLHLSIEIFEKRYHAKDFSGHLMSEYTTNAVKSARPAFTPIYVNQYSHTTGISGSTQVPASQWTGNHQFSSTQYHSTTTSTATKREAEAASGSSARKEKRQYKKRKHKNQRDKPYPSPGVTTVESMVTSDEEEPTTTTAAPNILGTEQPEDEGQFPFRRSKSAQYHKPLTKEYGNWPWESTDDNGMADPKYRFTLTSVRHQRPRCIGFARRRIGRGGRVILDRISTNMDEMWSKLDYTIRDSGHSTVNQSDSYNKTAGTIGMGAATSGVGSSNVGIENERSVSETSVVVDLVTNRKNSIDSVARTKTPSSCSSENIVIKNEQNTVVTVKQEKLDDIDIHLARLSSYSSNLSLGRLPSSSGVSSASSLLQRSDSNSNPFSQASIDRSEIYSAQQQQQQLQQLQQQRIGDVIIKSEQLDARRTCELSSDDIPKNDEQMYSEFLDEIRRDWLHFRPKTPSDSGADGNNDDNKDNFGEKPLPISESTPLTIEIQRLGNEPPSAGLFDGCDDNHLFVTNPFSLDEIMDDTAMLHTSNQDSSSSAMDINLSGSGDSLPELSLSLGENEDNEMLDNILQEVQLDDLKSFNANTNFWNGILEETAELCEVIDDPKKLSLDGEDRCFAGGRREKRRPHRNERVGNSTFNLIQLPKDDFFKKIDPTQQIEHAEEINKINEPGVVDEAVPVKVKQEPLDVNEVLTIKSENLPVIKTEIVHSSSSMVHVGHNRPIVQQQLSQGPQIVSIDNAALLQQQQATSSASATSASLIRRHTNGPTDKVVQNLLKQASLQNRKIQFQQQQRNDSNEQLNLKPKLIEGVATYPKMTSFSSPDFNVTSNNLAAFNAQTVASNHNYSLAPQAATSIQQQHHHQHHQHHHNQQQQQQQPQAITLIGQSPQSQNKYILSTSGVTAESNISYAAPVQDIQNKITIPSSNIKVNLMPATMSLSAADGKSTVLATQAHAQQFAAAAAAAAQQQTQLPTMHPNRKTVNMLYDSDKNRILYNTNIKNSRGQQIFAQLNSSKVLNILPIQHKNNASGTMQGIVAPSGLLNKAQNVQRISALANTQTISNMRQQAMSADINSAAIGGNGSAGGSGIGSVSAINVAVGNAVTNDSLTKLIQNNSDGGGGGGASGIVSSAATSTAATVAAAAAAAGVNLNTTNR